MKSIRIYHQFNGKNSLLALWSDLPDSLLRWFANNFNNPDMDSCLRPFDLREKKFVDFLDLCADMKQVGMNFPAGVSRTLGISEDEASMISHEIFIPFLDDVMTICARKLGKNLVWCFKDDCPREIEQRTGSFRGKIHSIRKRSFDSGRGSNKRYMHDAQYFVYADIDFYGFPVVARSRLSVDIRPALCEQNGKQRISEPLLARIKEKNVKRPIKAVLTYKYNDEWPWDITIVDENDIINQLDLKA